MATQLGAPTTACLAGRHRPKRVAVRGAQADLRTTCRDCGCALKRTLATKTWFYSGPLA